MLTLRICQPNQKVTGVLKARAHEGQWCYQSGKDAATGLPYVTPVATSGATQNKSQGEYFPILKWWVNDEDKETYHDNTASMPSGTYVTCLMGVGIEIEDDYLYTRGATCTGFYEPAASGGQIMTLSASGYPGQPGVYGDATASGAVKVAVLLGMNGDNVVYRTL